MHDSQLLLAFHRAEVARRQRIAEHERSARLAARAARMERWAHRSERLSERLAETAKRWRLLAQ